ncbi:uncharacterized protein LOC100114629 [Nasonia vitripennis]|uniref:DUF4773 domain-containing protein n=1 Tax=Nasonia vitripennis TaxID=7425 RepID=A0A7M7G9K8_NASVI|nr:uncharacterized protein LOC100114629 [Nasonia vitripennis]
MPLSRFALLCTPPPKMRLFAPTLLLLVAILAILTDPTLAKKLKKKAQKPTPKPVATSSTPAPQMTMAMRDLSQLKDLQAALRQVPPAAAGVGNVTTTGTTSVSATKQGPCTCGQGVCSCCSKILMNFWKQRACVNVTYDPDEFAFTAKLSMNEQLLFTRTVSGKNPRPVCVPVPRLQVVRACIRFYNIHFIGRNVHACVNMEGKFQETTLFKVGMDCLRLGQNGVALVKPEDGGGIGQVEFLPEDPDGGESGEDYDGYDEYDDDDGDDEDLFDY